MKRQSISRRAVAGAAIACAVGVSVWALRHGEVAPVGGASCAGLLDALGAWYGRLAPDAPLGRSFLLVNELLRAVGAAALTVLLALWSGSWWIAAAVAFAAGLSPLVAVGYAPFDPVVLIVAVATMLAVIVAARRGWSRRRLAASAGLLALTVGAARLTAAFVVPNPPPLAGAEGSPCAVGLLSASPADWLHGWQTVVTMLGPYAVGLAAVGVFVVTRRRELWREADGRWAITGALLFALALFPSLQAEPDRTPLRDLGALVAGYTLLVAAGLSEIARAARQRVGGSLGGALLVALLPVLVFVGFTTSPAAERTEWGVEALSANDVRRILAVLPDDSVIVEEDAAFAALLRSADGFWQRSGKHLRVATREPDQLVRMLSESDARVYALPAAQTSLQWRGFRLAGAELPGVAGIATVELGGPCVPATRRWATASSIAASGASVLSVVTPEFGEAHALVVYVAPVGGSRPAVIGNFASERLGFHAESYIRADGTGDAPLNELFAADGLPPALAEGLGPTVGRVEVWREAGLPAVLPIDLGGVPEEVVLRSFADTPSDRICPAFPYNTQPVKMQQ